MPDSLGRLFVAVPISPEIREALREQLRHAGVDLPGRAVPPESWHLTLRFLGETPRPAADALRNELARADLGGRFVVRFGGYGAFPRPGRASVLWLGVAEGAEHLSRLAGEVEAAARRAGLPPEERPYRPHLTLSRTRGGEDVRPLLARLPAFSGEMEAAEVVLFRSHLGRGPARYEALERFALR